MIRYVGSMMLFLGILHINCVAGDSVEKFRGVCFSSVRDNESPARQIQSLPSTVEEDVAMASQLAKSIRTYTLSGSNYLIPDFCNKHHVDCIVGAWIGPVAWQNESQLDLLSHLLKSSNDRVKALIIGNEALHRGDCTEAQLIEYIRRIKADTAIPVASAETWRAWMDHPKLAEAVDICGVQIYPYWEGRSVDGAAAYTVQRVMDIQKLYPNKRIILTEFGWPTSGKSLGEAHASPENAAFYLREVIPLLEKNDIEYYYFAVWDEAWKVGPEGSVGAHWGLFESSGAAKPEFEGLLPLNSRTGSNRSPRTMTFQLEDDQGRNVAIAEAAFGPRTSDSEQQPIAQHGAGLEFTLGEASRNSYAGLRPLRIAKEDVAPSSAREVTRPFRTSPSGESTATAAIELGADDGFGAESREEHGTSAGQKDDSRKELRKARTPLGPSELYGICLSLFRDEETPHFGIMPLVSELREDVSYAGKLARAVRTYSVTDSFAFLPELCDTVGIDCFPGASLGKYPWLNDLELEMLIRVGQTDHPSVQAVIVGNEVMHRGDFSVEQYIQYIRRVKKRVRVPVATAELLHSWLEHPELADEVDILGVQIYPYWGGLAIGAAATNTVESVQQLQARFPGKRIILTEFGWPTEGGAIGDAAANAENAAQYVREVIPLLNQSKIEYMYFALTDEKWKQRDEGGPGPHWGLLFSDGRVKPTFRSLLPPSAVEGFKRLPRQINFHP